ncbi:PhzF family isomerase [Pontimicrobium sp. SW4]|uniref:PhzF family isomerase n=1 Tax=Pontimicrobium sp. SW4 TaxID=3153519 RepID=A0AAU7BT48_9FLAO
MNNQMKNRAIYQIDAFTKEKFKGNPAGVVLNAEGLSEDKMQQIARELNNSETAFIFPPNGKDNDGVIRYFTPTVEVPICGHATISAMYAKAISENLDSCVLNMKTGVGTLPFEIIKSTTDYKIRMTQGAISFEPLFYKKIEGEILTALGLKNTDIDEKCPIQIASTGHSKVMIGIKKNTTLNTLKPDNTKLIELSKIIECNGYYVFTFDTTDTNCLIDGRMFAPAIGINEDPVTGNANGPLGAYLVHHNLVLHNNREFTFKIKQGEKMGRMGYMDVTVTITENQPKKVQITGDAVLVFKTEIAL